MRFLPFFLLLATFVANAEVYKWVDEAGHVQFGDKPEADNAQPVKVRDDTTKGVDPKKELEKTRDIIHYTPDERAQREEIISKQNEAVSADCTKAKGHLEKYRAAPTLLETDDKGMSIPVSKDKRAKAITDLEQQIKERCEKGK